MVGYGRLFLLQIFLWNVFFRNGNFLPLRVSVSWSRRISNWVQRDFDSGIGCFSIHPPQAYWKKSWHGSAVLSIASIKAAAEKRKIYNNDYFQLSVIWITLNPLWDIFRHTLLTGSFAIKKIELKKFAFQTIRNFMQTIFSLFWYFRTRNETDSHHKLLLAIKSNTAWVFHNPDDWAVCYTWDNAFSCSAERFSFRRDEWNGTLFSYQSSISKYYLTTKINLILFKLNHYD